MLFIASYQTLSMLMRCLIAVCLIAFTVAAHSGCTRTADTAATKTSSHPAGKPQPASTSKDHTAAAESSHSDQLPSHNVSTPAVPVPEAGSASAASSADIATPTVVRGSSPEPEESRPDEGAWTTERYVLAAKGGPFLIDIRVRIGSHDLATGFRQAIDRQVKELGVRFDPPMRWEELLEQPLVASGWLGNLVPTSEQLASFIALYDSNRNSQVDTDEVDAFLTRGLSRLPRLRVNTNSGSGIMTQTLAGLIDVDGDGQLTAIECSKAAQLLARFDVDGDHTLARAELQTEAVADGGMGNSSGRRSLIDSDFHCALNPEQIDATLARLLDAYTFSDSIPIKLFSSWSSEELKVLDQDGDEQITRSELKQLTKLPAHAVLQVVLPDTNHEITTNNVSGSSSAAVVTCISQSHKTLLEASGSESSQSSRSESSQSKSSAHWRPRGKAGRLQGNDLVLAVSTRDAYDLRKRGQFLERVESALGDASLFTQLQTQLELKGKAEEVLRRQPPEKIAAAAWHWSVGLRQWNVTIDWKLAPDAWFELLDVNGDGRLTETELGALTEVAQRLDSDQDGVLTESEGPFAVLLAVDRSGARGVVALVGGTAIEKRGANEILAPTWFLGMDYNSDGELSRAEFLGEVSDFDRLDLNGDGVIDANEVRH